MKINKENYQDILWRYLENELRPGEKLEVEKYIRNNEEASNEWELLKKTRLKTDTTTIFPNKQILYRKEEDTAQERKTSGIVKLLRYSAVAVAAALLAFGIILYTGKKQNTTETVLNHSKINQPAAPRQHITGKNIENSIADNTLGPKKSAPGKIDLNKKGQKTIPGIQKEKNMEKQPKNQEKHPTILIVEQPEKNNPMADISIKNNNEIENNYDRGYKDLQPLLLSHQVSFNHQASNNQANESKSLYDLFLDLNKRVSLKKKQENNKTYYALSIETNTIKINKTFKSFGSY